MIKLADHVTDEFSGRLVPELHSSVVAMDLDFSDYNADFPGQATSEKLPERILKLELSVKYVDGDNIIDERKMALERLQYLLYRDVIGELHKIIHALDFGEPREAKSKLIALLEELRGGR